jgi:hypothetical protein
MMSKKCVFLVALGVFVLGSSADAQLLYDFEAGIANVSNGAGFGFGSTTVAHSVGVGATEGSSGSLQATAPVDDFSWMAIINVNASPANVAAFAAASANPSAYTLEFDVTLDQSTMPDWTNFVNGNVVINSEGGGFDQAPMEPWGFGGADTWGVRHAVVPFTQLEDFNATPHGGGYFELGFSINGDWGDVPGSMYIDNIRLVPEPATFVLLGLALPALALAARRRR